jgi:hypothetical protein
MGGNEPVALDLGVIAETGADRHGDRRRGMAEGRGLYDRRAARDRPPQAARRRSARPSFDDLPLS